MLVHRLRRWANIKTTFGECLVFAEMCVCVGGGGAVADPECARGGGVSHILAEKRFLAALFSKKMHENAIFSPIRGGGGRAYAGSQQAQRRCFNVETTLKNSKLTLKRR